MILKGKINFFQLLLAFLITHNANAQEESYFDGKIIGHDGDTIVGLIQFDNEINLQSKINFKSQGSTDFKVYLPGSVHSFEVKNLIFQSVNIEMESVGETTLFLRRLVYGPVTLFRYSAPLNIKKYYSSFQEDKKAEELIEDYNKYQAVLSYFLANCSSLKERIFSTSFEERKLVRLIDDYNLCYEPTYESVFKKKPDYLKSPLKVGFSGSLGISVDVVSISKDSDLQYLSSLTLEPQASLYYEMNVRFPLSSISENLTFSSGYAFGYREFLGTSNIKVEGTVNVQTNKVLIQLESYSIPFFFSYLLTRTKTKPIIHTGFIYRNLEEKVNSRVYIDEGAINLISEDPAVDMKRSELGFLFGLAVDHNINQNLSLEAGFRYIAGNGIDSNKDFKTTSRFQVLVGLVYAFR